MAEAAKAGLLPSVFTVTTPRQVDVEVLDRLRDLPDVHTVTASTLHPEATTGEILSSAFISLVPGRPSPALSADDDDALGLWAVTDAVVIDPRASGGDADLEDDLEVVAAGLEALGDLEVPDSAVVSATERVLAAYDELCAG
jgi:hypothetical protein